MQRPGNDRGPENIVEQAKPQRRDQIEDANEGGMITKAQRGDGEEREGEENEREFNGQ